MRVRCSVSMLGLVAVTLGCVAPPPPVDPYAPRPVRILERWRVERRGELLGVVTKIEIVDPAGGLERFEVETVTGQRAGFIDGSGGVYQWVPFADEEQFRGNYRMEEGLAMLYEVELPIRLVPVPPADSPASASR